LIFILVGFPLAAAPCQGEVVIDSVPLGYTETPWNPTLAEIPLLFYCQHVGKNNSTYSGCSCKI